MTGTFRSQQAPLVLLMIWKMYLSPDMLIHKYRVALEGPSLQYAPVFDATT
jgi:hypothetical protein